LHHGLKKKNGGLVEMEVEVYASGRLESGGQREYISLCRIVMIVISNNTVFLSNL
jgi:hypothetical protein